MNAKSSFVLGILLFLISPFTLAFCVPSPDPIITSITYPDSITLGQSVTIEVTAKNHGGNANWQTLAISFPDNPAQLDIQYDGLGNSLTYYPPDEMGYNYGSTGERRPISYKVVEGSKEWNSGEYGTIRVSVTPENVGDFRFYVKTVAADMNGNVAAWFPTYGIRDQQNEYASEYIIKVNPKPDCTVTSIAYPDSITLGQSATIEVKAINHGGDAKWQTLSVAFPSNPSSTSILYDGLGNSLTYYPPDEMGYNYGSTGERRPISYKVIEGSNHPWVSGAENTLRVSVTPENVGDFRFYVKTVAADMNGNVAAWFPTYGIRDQQNEYASEYIIKVNPEPEPEFIDTENNAPEGAENIKVGRRKNRSIDQTGDVDYYIFSATVGNTYAIEILNSRKLEIQLYNSDGSTLLANSQYDFESGNEYISWICGRSDNYYIKVKSVQHDLINYKLLLTEKERLTIGESVSYTETTQFRDYSINKFVDFDLEMSVEPSHTYDSTIVLDLYVRLYEDELLSENANLNTGNIIVSVDRRNGPNIHIGDTYRKYSNGDWELVNIEQEEESKIAWDLFFSLIPLVGDAADIIGTNNKLEKFMKLSEGMGILSEYSHYLTPNIIEDPIFSDRNEYHFIEHTILGRPQYQKGALNEVRVEITLEFPIAGSHDVHFLSNFRTSTGPEDRIVITHGSIGID